MTSSRVPAGPVRPSLHDLLLVAVDRAIVELSRIDRTDVAEIREQLGHVARVALGASAEARGDVTGGSSFLAGRLGHKINPAQRSANATTM